MNSNVKKIVDELKAEGKLDEANAIESYVSNLEKSYASLEAESKKAFAKRDNYKKELESFKAKEQAEMLKDIPEEKQTEFKELVDKGLSKEQALKVLDIEIEEDESQIKAKVDEQLEKQKDVEKEPNKKDEAEDNDMIKELAESNIEFG